MKQMWCAIMLAAAVATAGAQGGATEASQKPADKPAASGSVTLTGCLQTDANKTLFWLSDASSAAGQQKSEPGAATSAAKPDEMKSAAKAETYRLNPASSVSLQPHVGHKVEITGMIDRSAASAGTRGTAGTERPTAGAAAGAEAKLENARQVNVTAVKHISPTCEPAKQ